MLESSVNNNKIVTKAALLILAQVFLFIGLAYPYDYSCLRSPVMFTGDNNRTREAESLAIHSSLNDYFQISSGREGEKVIDRFIKGDPEQEKTWVLFGDMSGIRLMNTSYHPEVLDVLIPMTVHVLSDFLKRSGTKGVVVRVGVKGDEIQMVLASSYTKESVDKIRKQAQEEVAKFITGRFWVCRVDIFDREELLDANSPGYPVKHRYREATEIASKILRKNENFLPMAGFYKDQDGVFMVFEDTNVQDSIISATAAIEDLNKTLSGKNLKARLNNSIRPFGLLSPRVLFGATQRGHDLKKAEERAERTLNVAKDFDMQGATDGLLSEEAMAFIDLERQVVFKTSENERRVAISEMNREEVSGVKVYPEQFDPAYLALGERHLRPLLEEAMNVSVTQGLLLARQQPVLVALLDVRYLPKGKFWDALTQNPNFNTQEKRIGNLRGQVDEHFGETVAFKYFNDGLKGVGLEKEGHSLGNEVLKAEAKGIIEDVIMKLERQNILLFRGPPDNWYFVFLNPVGREYYESQEKIGEFVDLISRSFNTVFDSMGLDIEVKLRMNVVSSTDVGIAPGTIVSTVNHIAKSRDWHRTKSYKTGEGNIVKIYDPGRRRALDEELSLIRREDRLKAQGLLAGKVIKAISADHGENAIAIMRVMEQSGWLASNATFRGDPKKFPADLPNSGNIFITIDSNVKAEVNEEMVSQITERFEKIFARPELNYDEEFGYQLSYIGQELLGNSIRHGIGEIAISYSFTEERTELKIENTPQENFDLGNLPDPTKEENILKPDGRGLLIIKAFLKKYESSADFRINFLNGKVVTTLTTIPLHPNRPQILENGASIYSVKLPGTDRQVGICSDPATIKLIQELPEGVTLNIFGNQAIQMILGREGEIAKTGKLAEGDFDCYIENNSKKMVDDAIGRTIRTYHPEHEFQEIVSKNIFDYLTSGPFTVNRLIVKLTSLGNGKFDIGFGAYMDADAYDDLSNRKVNIAKGIKETEYNYADRAIQGLIYHHRYAMHIEPEAARFIKDALITACDIKKPLSMNVLSLSGRLHKLFKYAPDPISVVEQLYQMGALEQPLVEFIAIALNDTKTLGIVLTSRKLSAEARLKLIEGIRTRDASSLLVIPEALCSSL